MGEEWSRKRELERVRQTESGAGKILTNRDSFDKVSEKSSICGGSHCDPIKLRAVNEIVQFQVFV